MQNYDKVVARRFLVRIAGRLHRPERRYRRFFEKRQSFKACMDEAKGIFFTLMVDNTHTNSWTQISEDLKC